MTENQVKLIRDTLFEENLAEMAIIDTLPDEEIIFSDKYRTEMQKLLNKYKNRIGNTKRKIPNRLIGILAAVIITLCMLMSISAARDPIINFIVNIYESFIEVTNENWVTNSNVTKKIEIKYIPSYMIEGFTVMNYDEDITYLQTKWTNNDKYIKITQRLIVEGADYTWDNENVEYIKTNIGPYSVYYMNKKGSYFFYWIDDQYLFDFKCSDSIKFSEMIKVIESIKPVEK